MLKKDSKKGKVIFLAYPKEKDFEFTEGQKRAFRDLQRWEKQSQESNFMIGGPDCPVCNGSIKFISA